MVVYTFSDGRVPFMVPGSVEIDSSFGIFNSGYIFLGCVMICLRFRRNTPSEVYNI